MNLKVARRAVVLALFLPTACATPPHRADLDPDAVYASGASRARLEDLYGPGRMIYCRDTVPADDFAAASVRAFVATGKPRPTSYQVFTRRNPADGTRYRDYVFYDGAQSVLHVARRRD